MKPTKNTKTQSTRTRVKKDQKCYFCESKGVPDYKETLVLRRFVSERGKIQPGSRTGICSKHQRALSKEVKKARFMSLIYYTEAHSL